MLDNQPAPPPLPNQAPRPIAHWTHTLALFVILALTTIFGRLRTVANLPHTGHLLSYATSILIEWLLLGAVIAGIYRRREFFLIAFRNRTALHHDSAATTFGLGVVVYILSLVALAIVSMAVAFTPLAHHRNLDYVLAMLPHTVAEFVLWFLVSLTAGVCEELIFRGYLLQQFTAWTKRPIVSILLVALLFGSVHLYEGLEAILPLTALAVVYGLTVHRFRGDLRAVIIAHTLQDFLVAFFALAVPHLQRYQSTHGMPS